VRFERAGHWPARSLRGADCVTYNLVRAERSTDLNDRPQSQVKAFLFDAENGDTPVEGAGLDSAISLSEKQLLWIDLINPPESELQQVADKLALPQEAIDGYLANATNPALDNCGECFWLRVVAVDKDPGNQFSGTVLTIIAGKNMVITVAQQQVHFLEKVNSNTSTRGSIGGLGAGSFVAALLEWQLGTYFDAVARFEIGVERLEVDVLSTVPRDCLAELRDLRKAASRLRRMLAPHRVVFSALPRPDFRPEEDERTERHFRALDTHFERAMDMVENARDLVVGSFELFSSQTALAANETMKVLTFATVVIGVLAVIGGILGMNFEAPFFKTGVIGFCVAVGAMLVLAIGAVFFGKRHRWF